MKEATFPEGTREGIWEVLEGGKKRRKGHKGGLVNFLSLSRSLYSGDLKNKTHKCQHPSQVIPCTQKDKTKLHEWKEGGKREGGRVATWPKTPFQINKEK